MGKLYMVYFSATGNTRKIVEKAGSAFDMESQVINLMKMENRVKQFEFHREDLVILGAPVYAGRIPELNKPLFTNLKGDGTPAILVVTYGNRAYEDALLELKHRALEQGFIPLVGGAFLGQHTYSDLLAASRPGTEDLECAHEMAVKAADMIKNKHDLHSIQLQVPGDKPYRKGMGFVPLAPKADSRCDRCGRCAKVCPVGAIKEKSPGKTNVLRCINCFACVQACPRNSRAIRSPLFDKTVGKLVEHNQDRILKSEVFIGNTDNSTH